jgi:hypothetical protein
VSFVWTKGLNGNNIHKVMFTIYGGKCLSRKAIHNGVEIFSQGRSKTTDDPQPVAEVAGTIIKRLLCFGFRHIGKAMGQVYQCWWRICRDIKCFYTLEYHMFLFVLYHL